MIRILVAWIFLVAGGGKFADPEQAAGMFESMGFNMPMVTAMFVATFEVVCGSLVLLGLLTRAAAIPLIVIMAVALTVVKIPLFEEMPADAALQETWVDVSLLLANLYLLIAGGGRFAVDRMIASRTPDAGQRTEP